MSDRKRKSNGEPGRALPNLPKFLQGGSPPTPSKGAAKPAAPEREESKPADASDPPASPKKPATPQAPAKSGLPPKEPKQGVAPAEQPKPKPVAPASEAKAKDAKGGASLPNRPKVGQPTAKSSGLGSEEPAKPQAPRPVIVKQAPAKEAPSKKAAPQRSAAQPTAAEPASSQDEPQKPGSATPSDAKPSGQPTRSSRPTSAEPPPAPVSPKSSPSKPSSPKPAAEKPVEAKNGNHASAPSPPTLSGEETSSAPADTAPQRPPGDATSEGALPRAIALTAIRDMASAEKDLRPILFAGPLRRAAKAPAAEQEADKASVSEEIDPKPPGFQAIAAKEPTAKTGLADAVARDASAAGAADPTSDPSLSPTPTAEPSMAQPVAKPVAAVSRDAPHAEPTDPAASDADRERAETARRRSVSDLLLAAAGRAKASGDTEETATVDATDRWAALRTAAVARPRAAGPVVRTEETLEEGGISPDVVVRRTPPFAVSLALHVLAGIVLALFLVPTFQRNPPLELDLNYATEDSILLETIDLELPTDLPDAADPLTSELSEVADPLAGSIELPESLSSFDLQLPTGVDQPSLGFSGRDEGTKKALLAAMGGTIATEDAVKLGLGWMKRQQQPDGRWLLSGPYTNGCSMDNPASATAMALLAFLGDGHTPTKGDFRQTVTKGADALLRFQDSDGNFYFGPEGQHRLYTQAQATIAVCELYGMTRDPRFREAAERALSYCLSAQSPEGGWRYYPGQESDTSVTGWFLMALKSAEMAGLDVPPDAYDRITAYLDRVDDDEGWRYRYRIVEPNIDKSYTKTMTAEGMLCRQYLGWNRDDPRMIRAVNFISESPIGTEESEVYYWYYASQTMHHFGGEPWENWNDQLREVLPALQEKKGREQGSWSPYEDEWGSVGGRLFMTALCLYTLEIYYRHLPLYQEGAGPAAPGEAATSGTGEFSVFGS